MDIEEVRRQAKRLPMDRRMSTIRDMDEVSELIPALKELFTRMDSSRQVTITHGRDEFGKDLVVIQETPFGREVNAVVVKRGNISGATRGNVDELREEVLELSSQEQRAFDEIVIQADMSAEFEIDIKTHLTKLPVTGIWVCLAGHLSNMARTRLRRKLNPLVRQIWDIAWIEHQFTHHYPEIYFAADRLKVLSELIARYERHNAIGNIIENFRLSDVFVEPLVCTVKLPGMETGEIKQEELDDISRLAERKRTPFSALGRAIGTKQRVILTGDMGSGKSGALTQIAIELCRNSHKVESSPDAKDFDQHSFYLPILINARDFLPHSQSIEDLVVYFFEGHEALHSRIQINALLIDGLDELPAQMQAEVIERARSLSSVASCSLMIASRQVEQVNVPPIGFVKYELLPFEMKQSLSLFKKLSKNSTMLKNLRAEMSKHHFNMPTTPLSLMLLAKIAEQYDEVPATITELYNRYTESALGRYDMQKGIAVVFDYKIKTFFISALAYECFQQNDVVEISRTEFNDFVKTFADRQGIALESVENFVWEIERAGLLHFAGTIVRFSNRTFLEYFAALHLHENREDFDNIDDMITELHFDPIWEEVSFFFVGLRSRMSLRLLEKILAYQHEDGLWSDISKVRVGRLLQAGYSTDINTKREGIRKAASRLPAIREQYAAGYNKPGAAKVPSMAFYLIVMSLADSYFRSVTLRNVVVELVDELGREPSIDSVRVGLPLLCALKDALPKEEFRAKAQPILDSIPHLGELTPTERTASMMMLKMIYEGDSEVMTMVNRQLTRLKKRYPDSFTQLFYPKRFAEQKLLTSAYARRTSPKDHLK